MIEIDNLDDAQQERMCDLCVDMYETNKNTCEGCRCEVAFELLLDDIEEKELEREAAKIKEKALQLKIDSLLLLGTAKLFSEYSTRLIGEYKNTKQMHHYAQAVKYVDKFIDAIEKHVKSVEGKKTLEFLIVDLNESTNALRNELLNLYGNQQNSIQSELPCMQHDPNRKRNTTREDFSAVD